MAEDEKVPEGKPVIETPAPGPDPAVAELKAQNAQLQSQLAALNDTVNAALSARQAGGQGGGGTVTPQLRQQLKARGYSDADIDHNAPLILPWIEIMAPELVAMVESRSSGLDERLTQKEMEDDGETYPYARGLRAEMKKLKADAKKENRTLSHEAAYHTAVSLNLDKVKQLDTQRRAESAGSDAGAMSSLGHRASAGASARAAKPSEPQTAADLRQMSREDRLKFYEKNGNVPVQ